MSHDTYRRLVDVCGGLRRCVPLESLEFDTVRRETWSRNYRTAGTTPPSSAPSKFGDLDHMVEIWSCVGVGAFGELKINNGCICRMIHIGDLWMRAAGCGDACHLSLSSVTLCAEKRGPATTAPQALPRHHRRPEWKKHASIPCSRAHNPARLQLPTRTTTASANYPAQLARASVLLKHYSAVHMFMFVNQTYLRR